ncbi:hypothetical protein P4O66_004585 [Electrophorus voltai]|uniref:Uncharacterized protein n=1 Tax=Electrophorus voltai TaxID=2609070 RepID=A0AAD9E184_9TELE|nr:hypothetical protein P4O66_004585 [Electrophorus voltai]
MFATHRSSLTELQAGRGLSRLHSFPYEPPQGPRSVAAAGTGTGTGSGGGARQSSSGRLLSMVFSENMHTDIDSHLAEQGQRSVRPGEHAEASSMREVRATAQLRNLEDFLKSNAMSLKEAVSCRKGMSGPTLSSANLSGKPTACETNSPAKRKTAETGKGIPWRAWGGSEEPGFPGRAQWSVESWSVM